MDEVEEVRSVSLQVVVDTNKRTYQGAFDTIEAASTWLQQRVDPEWSLEAFLERVEHRELLEEVAVKVCRQQGRASVDSDHVNARLSVVVEAVLDTLREQDQKP